jgi:hypothetical protein
VCGGRVDRAAVAVGRRGIERWPEKRRRRKGEAEEI